MTVEYLISELSVPVDQSNANPEHRRSNRKPLWYFSNKWEVEKGRVVVIKVQEVHIHRSAG